MYAWCMHIVSMYQGNQYSTRKGERSSIKNITSVA